MGRDQLRPGPASTHRPLHRAASPGPGARLQHHRRRSRLDLDRQQEPAPDPCDDRWPHNQLSQDSRNDLSSTAIAMELIWSAGGGRRPPLAFLRLRAFAHALPGGRGRPGHFSGRRSQPRPMDLYRNRRSLPFHARHLEQAERSIGQKAGHPRSNGGRRGGKRLVWLLQQPGRMGRKRLPEILFPQRYARCLGNHDVGPR